ncbi:unnamed protein product [Bursaphelenchus xylophilus]|uniref:(pine wood nematode) hypothetical protein n=1 Tax=Bursaphelenchus xylophilus TaxID=6326 RepID=A0A1I7RHE1_BURXY|nr:unnamed protein product [Bursaphelenchus xylophilus]CAG9115819.1 unnamed protein product [Bursaphelenchus xylophilus]
MSNYIASAQKPTVVNGAEVGRFRNEKELDLIIARINRIELLLVTEEGLKPHREIPIFGRIVIIRSFKPLGENKDLLLIVTSKYQVSILAFDANGEVITRASGNVADRVFRPAETGILISIHKSGLIALRCYEGSLKIIKWNNSGNLVSFNLRLTDVQVTDFGFLDTPGKVPSLGYIYQDASGRHLKVCRLNLEEKELSLDWTQENIESEASLLIPVPHYGGVIVVGQESISYHKAAGVYTAVSPFLLHMAEICCYCLVDKNGERLLLGDIHGRLFLLVLHTREQDNGIAEVSDIKVQLLGEISIPECVVYLDNSVIFVGSRMGDSQLIKILPEALDNQPTSFIEVLDSFPNLGPIRDLIVINSDGQKQVVTCSGGFKEGSLRIVRSGIGIDEQATVDLPRITNLFTLRFNSNFDNYLVVSFSDVTHLFKIDGEDLEDTKIEGFELNKSTIFAGVLFDGSIIQIFEDTLNLIGRDGSCLCKEPFEDLTLCDVNLRSGQVLVSSRNTLFYYKVENNKFSKVSSVDCERQISCLALSSIEEDAPSNVCVVGFWVGNLVSMFTMDNDTLTKVRDCNLPGKVLPRSILLTKMDNVIYLLVALGDGTLFYYSVDPVTGETADVKKATLGTQPSRLRKFLARNVVNVFACSDRPAVIYSSNQKLIFSNVNLKMVTQMCPLNAEAYPNSLVLSDGERMFIGVIDDIQKLHIRSVPLGESVSRIAYQSETNSIAILTQRTERILPNGDRQVRNSAPMMCANRTTQAPMTGSIVTSSNEEEMDAVQIHSLCLLDVNTFEILHVIEMPSCEFLVSVASVKLGNCEKPFFVVGTAIFSPSEPECKQGRILVYAIDEQKLRLVNDKEVKGAVFSISTLNNKLICSINSSVRLFEWTPENELRLECSSFNFITALYLKTKGDLVLVGDIMRSMTLLTYKSLDSQLEEVARDYNAEWTTAVEIIDSDTMIAAENAYNLYVVHKEVHPESDDERTKFQQTGYWYLGENVNVFRRGSLLTSNMDPSTSYSNPVLFGTADGSLGVIVQLKEDVFQYVQALQKAITNNVTNCTRIAYDNFRNFNNEKKVEKHCGFVDGDLIEGLADMHREKLNTVAKDMVEIYKHETTADDILRLVEDLSRLH